MRRRAADAAVLQASGGGRSAHPARRSGGSCALVLPHGVSPSPYLDHQLFQFDDKLIATGERPRPCVDYPIKFVSRTRHNTVRFRILTRPQQVRRSQRAAAACVGCQCRLKPRAPRRTAARVGGWSCPLARDLRVPPGAAICAIRALLFHAPAATQRALPLAVTRPLRPHLAPGTGSCCRAPEETLGVYAQFARRHWYPEYIFNCAPPVRVWKWRTGSAHRTYDACTQQKEHSRDHLH
jgi:hypothetical protein